MTVLWLHAVALSLNPECMPDKLIHIKSLICVCVWLWMWNKLELLELSAAMTDWLTRDQITAARRTKLYNQSAWSCMCSWITFIEVKTFNLMSLLSLIVGCYSNSILGLSVPKIMPGAFFFLFLFLSWLYSDLWTNFRGPLGVYLGPSFWTHEKLYVYNI